MEIQNPKYSIGQVVYYMSNDAVKALIVGRITGNIDIELGCTKVSFSYAEKKKEYMGILWACWPSGVTYSEEKLYPSKEELLASL